MKTRSLLYLMFVVIQFCSLGARAERYLVTFKSRELHQELLTQKNPVQLQSIMKARGYTLSAEKIQKHLSALNTVVVKDISLLEAESLKRNQNVLFVEKEVKRPLPFPVGLFKKPILNTSPFKFFEQQRPWGVDAVRSPVTWNATSGGHGARVLVLDTGIDREHPAVRPNLVGAKDFVGDNQTEYSYKDTVGHGTHVAGTIAGVLDKSGFAGVAPKASLLAGRVCAEDGCSSVAIAEGINWGVEQHVDVISMSLGGMWSSMGERLAVKRAYEAGIVLVAASGNDGTDSVGYPAALPECIAVGAVDDKMRKAEFSQYGPELAVVAPGVDIVSSVPLGSGREPMVSVKNENGEYKKVKATAMQGAKTVTYPMTGELVYVGLGKPEDFEKIDMAGKIALIRRGELKFSEKVENALKAKAAGVLVFNNEPGLIRGLITEDGTEVEISAYVVEQSVGEAIVERMKRGETISAQSYTLITNHMAMNGTSMATPHVSGVVALMKSVNRDLTPDQVKAILMGTALKISNDTENKTGAGMVQADKAVRAALMLTTGFAP